MTECNQLSFGFHPSCNRELVARFDGGTLTSDGGALLLRQVEESTGLLRRFSLCFRDHRDPELIEHAVYDLIAQRVYGLALGYEDLNDHDTLRQDPLLAMLVGKKDPTGAQRLRRRDQGKPLAGKSTLNRLELTPVGAGRNSRYKKIAADCSAIEDLFVEYFLAAHPVPPARIVLDLDATDDPVHGNQLGGFFHGYYKHYCFLPLYIFCGEYLLCARLRPSNIDASAGSLTQLKRIVRRIRQAWPTVQIVIRGDSGFCRDHIMTWCEQNNVDYLLGLAKNKRLLEMMAEPMQQAQTLFEQTGQASRVFKDLQYSTLDSWSDTRRVVGKAEHLSKGPNPRFVVTTIPAEQIAAAPLYEKEYCSRGEMENRIKEQQLLLVRRSHQRQDDASQPTANVLQRDGLHVTNDASTKGRARHVIGTRPLRHHPAETAEDRGSHLRHRPQGMAVAKQCVPISAAIRPGGRESTSRICGADALLTQVRTAKRDTRMGRKLLVRLENAWKGRKREKTAV